MGSSGALCPHHQTPWGPSPPGQPKVTSVPITAAVQQPVAEGSAVPPREEGFTLSQHRAPLFTGPGQPPRVTPQSTVDTPTLMLERAPLAGTEGSTGTPRCVPSQRTVSLPATAGEGWPPGWVGSHGLHSSCSELT